jgi:hypothetical protein
VDYQNPKVEPTSAVAEPPVLIEKIKNEKWI